MKYLYHQVATCKHQFFQLNDHKEQFQGRDQWLIRTIGIIIESSFQKDVFEICFFYS